MKRKVLTCVNCPLGCTLTVDFNDVEVIKVQGNTCPRGVTYAKDEIFFPKRMVTSTVKLMGCEERISVKTSTAISKDKIFEVMKCIKETEVKPPIEIGDIIIDDVASTGVNVVATKEKRYS